MQDHQHPHGRNANPHLEKRDNVCVRHAVSALAADAGNDSVLGVAVHSASGDLVRRTKVELEVAPRVLHADLAPVLVAPTTGVRAAAVGPAGVQGRSASRGGVLGPDDLHDCNEDTHP